MSDSLVPAEIEHRLPGRVRLRMTSRRGDSAFFTRMARELSGWPGLRSVRATPLTGSLLVEHTDEAGDWLSRARTAGLFDAAEPGRFLTTVPAAREGRSSLPSPLDMAATGLAAAGVLQLARGQVLGSASENLWNAYGLWIATRRPWLSAVLCAFGLLQLARGEVLGSATSLFLYAFSARRLAQHLKAEDTI